MDETDDRLAIKVQALSDLELAVLICFVAEQHCIIEAEEHLTNDVAEELKLVDLRFYPRRSAILKVAGRERRLWSHLRGTRMHGAHHAR
jgi:hypothetical protein